MLIVNADDFGGNHCATDTIFSCFMGGRITSTSAMVFMEDSLRAAKLAREFELDVGLHINFTQELTQQISNRRLISYHNRIVRYLNHNKHNWLLYNPFLRNEFDYVYHTQLEEYERIYGTAPTHIDGHHHMHLCANMITQAMITKGQIVRRNYTYAPGEKPLLNRVYRSLVDKILKRRYLIVDYLFSLLERLREDKLNAGLKLAIRNIVELQTHPQNALELQWLNSNHGSQTLCSVKKGDFSLLKKSFYSGQELRF